MRQHFPPAAGGGERGGAGEAELAEREVERVDPGMGMGEPSGGLGEGHADDQPLADFFRCRRGAGVEPGERVGRIAERGEEIGEIMAAVPGTAARDSLRPGGCGRATPEVGVGFVRGVLPGGAKERVRGVQGLRIGVRRHGGVSLRVWCCWVSMPDQRRFLARSVRLLGCFSWGSARRSRTRDATRERFRPITALCGRRLMP